MRTAGAKDIDWVLVRENSEGEYCGHGGRSHRGQVWEVATEVAIFTYVGVERIMRFAFETAQSRSRKLLTVVTKSNSLRHGLVLWDEVALVCSMIMLGSGVHANMITESIKGLPRCYMGQDARRCNDCSNGKLHFSFIPFFSILMNIQKLFNP